MSEPRRILTFTSLFPSSARPRHGIFVQTRLQQVQRRHPVDVRVVAPVPWFPFRSTAFGDYAKFAATPRRATLDGGLQVSYPRYLMLPKIGVARQPDAMARAAMPEIEQLRASGWVPQLIDAHYLYPDGVAAALLAERTGTPFVMTARGTDVNVLARMPGPGRRIAWAARRAAAVIAVSAQLKKGLVELGVDADRVVVLRNGVDPEQFRPVDRASARREFALPDGPLIAGVGNLVPEKGFELAIEALALLPAATLVLVGDGPQHESLAALARRRGVSHRLRMLPVMPQSRLPSLYSAADALVVTSTREGWPNVVLEALSCGTPVASVDVGAVGEILTDSLVGRVVGQRDPGQLATAVRSLLQAPPASEAVRRHAGRFDWATIARGQFEVFEHALTGTPQAVSRNGTPPIALSTPT
ncbi:MAG TPA: glycosyltransferase [Burkholderiaceae bacterium]|nr:glycosyltransferase [Burkholderiaceae bacterium]